MQLSNTIAMVLLHKAMDLKDRGTTDNGLISFEFLLPDFRCSTLRISKTIHKIGMKNATFCSPNPGQFCSVPAGVVGKL